MRILDRLQSEPHPLAREVVQLSRLVGGHPLFDQLGSVAAVRTFMEHHVWAVWDFMTLLKSLQQRLAPVKVPWRPPADRPAARLINQIVLGEESDLGPDGAPASHFEIYRQAMVAAGADDRAVRAFLALLDQGVLPVRALTLCDAPTASLEFVRGTLTAVAAPLPYMVAAFTVGREEVIPAMFMSLVAGLAQRERGCDLGPLIWYLERHVQVDGDEHGPQAAELWQRLCAGDEQAHEHSLLGARDALRARARLWDAVLDTIGDQASQLQLGRA